LHTSGHTRKNSSFSTQDEHLVLLGLEALTNGPNLRYATRSKYVKKAGIRKKVSVHTLRHTFGAHKADKNMSLATLQELMGHKKKETTLKYIHLAKTNLRQEVNHCPLKEAAFDNKFCSPIEGSQSLLDWASLGR
jgi:integrase